MRCLLRVFLHLNIVDEETRSESQRLTFPTIGLCRRTTIAFPVL